MTKSSVYVCVCVFFIKEKTFLLLLMCVCLFFGVFLICMFLFLRKFFQYMRTIMNHTLEKKKERKEKEKKREKKEGNKLYIWEKNVSY